MVGAIDQLTDMSKSQIMKECTQHAQLEIVPSSGHMSPEEELEVITNLVLDHFKPNVTMNLYNKYLLPKVTNALCASGPNMKQRKKVIPFATGRVLEVGVGTGLNFPFYQSDQVNQLLALDPSKEMWALAKNQIKESDLNLEFIQGVAENIPVDAHSIDSIVITYTLCTIKNYPGALQEFKRVLKPNGSMIFCEHGQAPDLAVRRWQNILNPVWNIFGGGCNLNRDIPKMIEQGGFDFENLETMYIPGFKPACYNFWGVAKPA